MITYQANCIDPTESQKQSILNAIPQTPPNHHNTYLMQLQYPTTNSPQQQKWKWALIFTQVAEVNQFIQELEQSEEKQYRLGIEEYSVFGNVMFVFLKKQVKLHIWCSHIKDLIRHLPLGAFIFNERFKHLVDLVEKSVQVYYEIDWRGFMPQKRPLLNGINGGEIYKHREQREQMEQMEQLMSDSFSDQIMKKVKGNRQDGMMQMPMKRKRGRPRKVDQMMRQKLLEENSGFGQSQMIEQQQQKMMVGQRNIKDGYLEMLENLNKRYQVRYRRARIRNEEIAIKFDDFGECLLSLLDDQNYFVKGFYECLSQLNNQQQ